MGLFGNKREKSEKAEKYEHHSSSKGGRSGYGPPALAGTPPSPYFPGGGAFFDGFGQVAPQGKMSKYDKYGVPGKSFYGADPMQQAMLLPPTISCCIASSSNSYVSNATIYARTRCWCTIWWYSSTDSNAIRCCSTSWIITTASSTIFYGFGGQQAATPFFDPNNPAFQQQQGAFAPYQQPNFYDPAAAAAYVCWSLWLYASCFLVKNIDEQ